MHAPLADFLAALDDTLERYGVPTASVSAVATVGGGARIPLITQRLSEHLRAPVVTTPHPQLTAAEGAALIAHRGRVADTATTVTPSAPAARRDDDRVDGDRAVHGLRRWPGPRTTAARTSPTAALQRTVTDSRPEVRFRHEEWQDDEPPRRAPLVLFGLSAVAAAIDRRGVRHHVGQRHHHHPSRCGDHGRPSPAPAASAPSPAPPAPQAPQVTTVVVSAGATVVSAPRPTGIRRPRQPPAP